MLKARCSSFDNPAALEAESVLGQTFVFERRIHAEWKSLRSKKGPDRGSASQKKLASLAHTLIELYSKVIKTDLSLAIERRVLRSLWKSCFYKQLDKFQQYIKIYNKKAEKNETVVSAKMNLLYLDHCRFLRERVNAASAFFQDLVKEHLKIAQVEEHQNAHFVDLLLTKPTYARNSFLMSNALKLTHQCLIYLGDLQRYLEVAKTSEQRMKERELLTMNESTIERHRKSKWESSLARKYYHQAESLICCDGSSHNQLAVLATGESDPLVGMYHYFRALSARGIPISPIPRSTRNLKILFSNNTTRLLYHAKTSRNDSKMFWRLRQYIAGITTLADLRSVLVFLFSIIYDATDGNSYLDAQEMVKEILEKVDSILLQPLLNMERYVTEYNDVDDAPHLDIIYQITICSIFCVHHALDGEGSKKKRKRSGRSGSSYRRLSEDSSGVETAMFLALSIFDLIMRTITPPKPTHDDADESDNDEPDCADRAARDNPLLKHLLVIASIHASWLTVHPHFLIHPCGLSWRRPKQGKRLSTELGPSGFELRNKVFSSLAGLLNYLSTNEDVNANLPKPVEWASLLPEERDLVGFMYVSFRGGRLDPTAFFSERRSANASANRKGTHWNPTEQEKQLLRYCKLYNLSKVIAQKYEVMEMSESIWTATGLQANQSYRENPEPSKDTKMFGLEDVRTQKVAERTEVEETVADAAFEAANDAIKADPVPDLPVPDPPLPTDVPPPPEEPIDDTGQTQECADETTEQALTQWGSGRGPKRKMQPSQLMPTQRHRKSGSPLSLCPHDIRTTLPPIKYRTLGLRKHLCLSDLEKSDISAGAGWKPVFNILDIDSETRSTIIWIATNTVGRTIEGIVQDVESIEGKQDELEPTELPPHLRPIPLTARYPSQPASRSPSFTSPGEEPRARTKPRPRTSTTHHGPRPPHVFPHNVPIDPLQLEEESRKNIQHDGSVIMRNQYEESIKHVQHEESIKHGKHEESIKHVKHMQQATSGWIPRAQASSSTSQTSSDPPLAYQGPNRAMPRKQFSRASQQHAQPAQQASPSVATQQPGYQSQGYLGRTPESHPPASYENYRAQTTDAPANGYNNYRPANESQFPQYNAGATQRASNQSWWS